MPRIDPRGLVLSSLFRRWRIPKSVEAGYTILLPMPMDMLFLLRYALEGLRLLDTSNCRRILVLPDGWGGDGDRGRREVVASCKDARVEIVPLRPLVRFYIHRIQRSVLGSGFPEKFNR